MFSNEFVVAILFGWMAYILEMSVWVYRVLNQKNFTYIWAWGDVFGTYIYNTYGLKGVVGIALGEFNITAFIYAYVSLLIMKMMGYHVVLNKKITDTKNDIPYILAYLGTTWIISHYLTMP